MSRSDVEVWLGEHDNRESDGTEQHIMSSKFIRHPDYNPRTHDADQTEPPCRSEQLCTPCCTAFKVRRRRDDGPVLWMGQTRAVRRQPPPPTSVRTLLLAHSYTLTHTFLFSSEVP